MRGEVCPRAAGVLAIVLHAQQVFAGTTGTFVEIGRLPGGSQPYSESNGISADGSVVVGRSNSTPGYQGYRWTQAGGMSPLGDLFGGLYDSDARDCSADGSAIVGTVSNSNGWVAARWFPGTSVTLLGDLPGGVFQSRAYGVSSDGNTVVGESSSATGDQAFRWRGGTMSPLGYLGQHPGGFSRSVAADCSGDGETVVGTSSSAKGMQAFRWTQAGGMVALGDLPGGAFISNVAAISRDGSTIVGSATADFGATPCVWRSGLGPRELVPGASLLGAAIDASADGSVIVGTSDTLGAFVWSERDGLRSIQDLLETDFGISLPTWTLTHATAISDDGRTIAGFGWNVLAPGGRGYEAFVVTIPSPMTCVVFVPLLAHLARRRRS